MKFLPDAVTRSAAMGVLRTQQKSPTILFGVGVASMIGSTVLACRATLKLEETLAGGKNDLHIANSLQHKEYTAQDRQRDVAIIYTRNVAKVGRLYAPSIVLGLTGIACLTKSHNILQERLAGVTAAYALVDKAFDQYRARVIEKYGEEEDRDFRYGLQKVGEVDGENAVMTDRRFAPEGADSMYARFFDQYSPNWSKEAEYNELFLRSQQNYCNDLLKARGHVFLNEVYDMLGLDRSRAGAVVGWVISRDGDNFIDFGYKNNADFINGREGAILLDFNVDGVIYDKIDETTRGERLQWQS